MVLLLTAQLITDLLLTAQLITDLLTAQLITDFLPDLLTGLEP